MNEKQLEEELKVMKAILYRLADSLLDPEDKVVLDGTIKKN